MPFALAYDITGNWLYGSTFCWFFMSWDVMCCTASLQHLAAIAWDRYVAITDPYGYRQRINLNKVITIIAGIWINSALLSFLPIFTGLSSKPGDTHNVHPTQCFLITNHIYAIISAMVSFYIPFGGMAFCYLKIFSIVWEKIKISEQQQRALRQAASQLDVADSEASSAKVSALSVGDLKATKTLGILFGVLFCCWLPFFLVYWINAFSTESLIPQPVHSIITWLGYLNSTMNPVIYSWNPAFRADYRQLFFYILSLCQNDGHTAETLRLSEIDSTREKLISVCSVAIDGQVLTEEDISELERIFWPTTKPLIDRSTTETRSNGAVDNTDH